MLVASNRGPVSFRLSDDGQLTSRRGGGGMVSGLSSVAGQAEVLWVCAALSDADRAAARAAPGGYLDTSGRGRDRAGSAVRMLDIPAATFDRAYNAVANSTLWFVHHMLYDTPNRPHFGLAFRREWESFRAYNAAFADALAARRGPGRPPGGGAGDGAGLPPDAGPPDARGPAARRGDRLLLPHPVGAARLFRDPARRRRPRGARRHARRRPRRVPHPAAGPTRSSTAARRCWAPRWTGPGGSCGTAATPPPSACTRWAWTPGSCASGPRPRTCRRMSTALASAAGGRKLIVRIDRTELSKNIVRGLAAYRELLVTEPGVAGAGDPPRVRLSVPARPARVPRVHRQRAAARPPDHRRVRHRGLGSRWSCRSTTTTPARSPPTGWPTCCWSTRSGTA